MADEGQCRSCGVPIVWAKHHRTGRPMPLELAPEDAEGGLWRINGQGRAVHVGQRGAQLGAFGGDVLYISHFATCEDGDSWRTRSYRRKR